MTASSIVLAVTGGRAFDDADRLNLALDRFHAYAPVGVLIEGEAPGADRLARKWAESRGVHVAAVAALWDLHPTTAGGLRNRAMAALRPHGLVAFPGGFGTGDMVRVAQAQGIPVWQPLAAPENPSLVEFLGEVIAASKGQKVAGNRGKCPMCGTKGFVLKCGYCGHEAVEARR